MAPILFLDTETTGLDLYDEVWEFAAIEAYTRRVEAENRKAQVERDAALTAIERVRELADQWQRDLEPCGCSLAAVLGAADGAHQQQTGGETR